MRRNESTTDEPITTMTAVPDAEAIDATVHLAFAFDIGDEIDLDRARLILQGEPGQLPRRRRTPESIRLSAGADSGRARAGRHRAARESGRSSARRAAS